MPAEFAIEPPPADGMLFFRRKPNSMLVSVFFFICTAVITFGASAPGDRGRLPENESVPRELSLQTSLRIGMLSNKSIRVASLKADQARALIDEAKGEFDPVLFLAASRGNTERLSSDISVAGTNTESIIISVGARKRSVTGTELEISSSVDYIDDDSREAPHDTTYESEVFLIARQDLLRDFGIGVNRSDILIRHNDSLISESAFMADLIENMFRIEEAYWNLYYAMADLAVRHEQLGRALRLVEIAEAQVRVGDASPIEITRAESGSANQAVAILSVEKRVKKLRLELLRLMGVLNAAGPENPDFELIDSPPAEAADMTLDEALEVALASRPDIAQAKLLIKNAAIRERLSANQKLPRVQLYGKVGLSTIDDDSASTGVSSRDERGEEWEVGVSAELPLPNRTAEANHVVAILARREAMVSFKALEERVTKEVADAVEALREAGRRMVTAEKAGTLARRLLDAEEKSFSLGRTDSLNVLNAQAALATASRDAILARTDYATALGNLHRVQGDFLQARDIHFAPAGSPVAAADR